MENLLLVSYPHQGWQLQRAGGKPAAGVLSTPRLELQRAGGKPAAGVLSTPRLELQRAGGKPAAGVLSTPRLAIKESWWKTCSWRPIHRAALSNTVQTLAGQ